jgi:hypothetical protein
MTSILHTATEIFFMSVGIFALWAIIVTVHQALKGK